MVRAGFRVRVRARPRVRALAMARAKVRVGLLRLGSTLYTKVRTSL